VAKLESGGVVAIPASWDDFMEFLHETRYRVEYHNGRMIVMGLAAFYHEVLIMAVGEILRRILKGKGFYVAGSNVGVLQKEGKGYYNPDITVVKGKPAFRNKSTAIITNPYFVVEVLSESTAAYDLYHKMPKYQRIISIQEVIFIDRFDVSVTVCRRSETPKTWTLTAYENLDESVLIAGEHQVVLRDFFADLPDEALGEQAAQ
jgi:Uma2 family endonuclease